MHYFRAIASVLAERQTPPPDCLVEGLLGCWTDVHTAARLAQTDDELYEAARMAYYGCSAADQILEGNGHAAVWTLHALNVSCKRFTQGQATE